MIVELSHRVVSLRCQLQNLAILVLIALCEFILLIGLKVIEAIFTFTCGLQSFSLFHVGHRFELLHFIVVNVDQVLVVLLALLIMVAAHRGVLQLRLLLLIIVHHRLLSALVKGLRVRVVVSVGCCTVIVCITGVHLSK